MTSQLTGGCMGKWRTFNTFIEYNYTTTKTQNELLYWTKIYYHEIPKEVWIFFEKIK